MWLRYRPYGAAALGAVVKREMGPSGRLRPFTREEEMSAVRAYVERGDEQPFREIFDRYARGLYLYLAYNFTSVVKGKQGMRLVPVLKIRGNKAVEEQISMPDNESAFRLLNKTYYNALRGLREFRGESTLGTWLHQIAHNVGVDELKTLFRNPEFRAARNAVAAAVSIKKSSDGELRDAAENVAAGPQAVEIMAGQGPAESFSIGLFAALAKATDERGRLLVPRDVVEDFLAYANSKGDFKLMAVTLGTSPDDARARYARALAVINRLKDDPRALAAIRRAREQG